MAEYKWEQGEIHAQNGLMFKRMDDGSVRIRLFADGLGPSSGADLVFQTRLPDSSWASIMASCCARDEDHLTHIEAMEFHNKPRDPA